MHFEIELSIKAGEELAEASAWYDEQKFGLGEDFETEVFKKLDLISKNPFHYQTKKKLREALVDRFPYLLVFSVHEKLNTIIILSVFHTSRHPKNKKK